MPNEWIGWMKESFKNRLIIPIKKEFCELLDKKYFNNKNGEDNQPWIQSDV